MIISEVKLRKIIYEELSDIGAGLGATSHNMVGKDETDAIIDELIDLGIIESSSQIETKALDQLVTKNVELVDNVIELQPNSTLAKGTASKASSIVNLGVMLSTAWMIYEDKGSSAAASWLAKEHSTTVIKEIAVQGITKVPMAGVVLAAVLMVPAVMYYDMQKFENDSNGMKIFKQLWKQQNAGLSRTADRDKLKPLHFGPGGGLQHPKNIIDKHDLEKNPIYRMIQSRLTNNNPVDVDNLLNKSMLTRDVVEYIKSFERARNKAENLVSTLSAIKILGKEKAKDLRSADWGEDKDKRRSQMQALVNATQGFYDQAKHAMWNYSQGKKHTHVTSQHVIDFSNAVDQLKKRIDDLSNVSYKDADDIITQKFISKGWKGATGFKSSHHDDYKKGIIGVLYKQNANAGGKNWKNRNTQMMKYWTEIGKKA